MERLEPFTPYAFPQSIFEIDAQTRFLLEGDLKVNTYVILLVNTKFPSSGLYLCRSFLPTKYKRSHFPITTQTKYVVKLLVLCQSHLCSFNYILLCEQFFVFICEFFPHIFCLLSYRAVGLLLFIFQKVFHMREINFVCDII